MATSMIRSKFWCLRKKAPITQFIIRNVSNKPYKYGQEFDPPADILYSVSIHIVNALQTWKHLLHGRFRGH